MFSKEELLTIEDALEENKNNKNKMVSLNRKQKKLWLVQNKLKNLINESK